jgi:hypothetical protein
VVGSIGGFVCEGIWVFDARAKIGGFVLALLMFDGAPWCAAVRFEERGKLRQGAKSANGIEGVGIAVGSRWVRFWGFVRF